MYIHLGQNVEAKEKEIIGIFDMDTSTIGKITKDFLYEAEKKNLIESVAEELPKSFIVCQKDDEKKIFISPIATTTLQKRTEMRSLV